MIIEICVQSLEGALMAEHYGADRIELCAGLETGGLTPSMGLFAEVKRQIQIPIHVLIRPRVGGFHYRPSEVTTMTQEVKCAAEAGADGIVIGALNADFTLDLDTIKGLIELAKTINPKIHITVHRAFDWVQNPIEAAKSLIDLGVHTLLTSGQAPTAKQGIELLKTLKTQYGPQLTIMPGSGISAEHKSLFVQAGFKAIHASASELITEASPSSHVTFETPRQPGQRRHISSERLKNLLGPS